jgi:nitroreductase
MMQNDYGKRHNGTSRRAFLAGLVAPVLVSAFSGHGISAQGIVKLPAPRVKGGRPFMEAIASRRSMREFGGRAVDEQVLSDLLWAAFGINRPDTGGHTAPSWHGSMETDIYIAKSDGVWLFEPKGHTIKRVVEADIRSEIGEQPYVGTAPVVLIFVADITRMYEGSEDEHRLFAYVDTAYISQNVYLFAASEGLNTVVIGSIKGEAVGRRLNLGKQQRVTLGQPIGYPA